MNHSLLSPNLSCFMHFIILGKKNNHVSCFIIYSLSLNLKKKCSASNKLSLA